MVTCRKCGEPAKDVRHEYTNEKILFVYIHEGDVEHKIWLLALDGFSAAYEDRMQQLR